MKLLLYTLVFICFSFRSFSQSDVDFNMYTYHCEGMEYCKDCGEPKAVYKGNLTQYFEKHVDWGNLSRISGVVVARVAVDTAGVPCMVGIYNYSTEGMDAIRNLNMDQLIWKMGKWQPAILDGKPVNSGVLVALYSRVKGHKMFEVGYLRNDRSRKWVVETENGPRALTYFDDTAKLPE